MILQSTLSYRALVCVKIQVVACMIRVYPHMSFASRLHVSVRPEKRGNIEKEFHVRRDGVTEHTM